LSLSSGQRGSGRRQLRATIPSSSMTCVSLLQIDVEVVGEPDAVVSDGLEAHTAFGRDNIYYML
jgi:hypothetical protein